MISIFNLILLICALATSNAKGLSSGTTDVYRVSSSIEWTIQDPNAKTLSAEELYLLERVSSDFFISKMNDSTEFENQNFVFAKLDMSGQQVAGVQSTMSALITTMYTGEEITEFSEVLSRIMTIDVVDSLMLQLKQSKLLSIGAVNGKLEIVPEGASAVVASTADNTILFIIILCFVALLILASFIMLATSDFCSCFCRKGRNGIQDGIKMTATEDTQDSHIPAFLGARREPVPSPNTSQYDITPKRGVRRNNYAETPDSVFSAAESTTSANPLGIVRLNTLDRIEKNVPIKKTHGAALYSISLQDDV